MSFVVDNSWKILIIAGKSKQHFIRLIHASLKFELFLICRKRIFKTYIFEAFLFYGCTFYQFGSGFGTVSFIDFVMWNAEPEMKNCSSFFLFFSMLDRKIDGPFYGYTLTFSKLQSNYKETS